MDSQDLSAQDLLRLCLQSQDAASRQEFVRRSQPTIARVVRRSLCRFSRPNLSLVDDLVQETYIKLFAHDWKALRDFHCDQDDPACFEVVLFGLLKTVASNVVHDHFRSSCSQKRGSGRAQEDMEKVAVTLPSAAPGPERNVLLGQILGCLRDLAGEPTFQRDWAIFQLYYFDGLTAEAIANLPGIDLKTKGVESALLRLVRYIRGKLGSNAKGARAVQ